ncbi:hypothetical protein ID866_1357 [Astraeus odoratus]|nr:hypothetical protein ID866_1357 [Astraeus odoratus]
MEEDKDAGEQGGATEHKTSAMLRLARYAAGAVSLFTIFRRADCRIGVPCRAEVGPFNQGVPMPQNVFGDAQVFEALLWGAKCQQGGHWDPM